MDLKKEREKQRRRWQESERQEIGQETANLKTAYENVMEAQQELDRVAKDPSNYSERELLTYHAMAVQGHDALIDIDKYARENSIPLDPDMNLKFALGRQEEIKVALKTASNGKNKSTSRRVSH